MHKSRSQATSSTIHRSLGRRAGALCGSARYASTVSRPIRPRLIRRPCSGRSTCRRVSIPPTRCWVSARPPIRSRSSIVSSLRGGLVSLQSGQETIMRLPYDTLAPDGLKALGGVYAYVSRCGLEKPLIDLAYLRASQLNGCAYCIDMHTHDAIAEGASIEKLMLVSAWREAG